MSKFPFSALIGPKVRTVDVEGKTYFVAKDFCQSIGLKDHKKSTANFYEGDTMYWKVPNERRRSGHDCHLAESLSDADLQKGVEGWL